MRAEAGAVVRAVALAWAFGIGAWVAAVSDMWTMAVVALLAACVVCYGAWCVVVVRALARW